MTTLESIARAIFAVDVRRLDESAKRRAIMHGYSAPLDVPMPDFAAIGEVSRDAYMQRAMAALDVIEEPTDAMIKAMINFRVGGTDPDQNAVWLSAKGMFTAAVKAAKDGK